MVLESIQLKEEEKLFYGTGEESKELGCIGYLRGDFGESGKDFYSTWFPEACHELKNEVFKAVFDKLINDLREEGQVLGSRSEMYNHGITAVLGEQMPVKYVPPPVGKDFNDYLKMSKGLIKNERETR